MGLRRRVVWGENSNQQSPDDAVLNEDGSINEELEEKKVYLSEFQERLRFLAHAWSGKKFRNIIFDRDLYENAQNNVVNRVDIEQQKKDVFYSNVKQGVIYAPTVVGKDQLFDKSTPEDLWRVIRYLVWHEGQHVQYTPRNHQATCENKDILDIIYNGVEDLRVERMGFRRYRGMKGERDFMAAAMAVGIDKMLHELAKQQGKNGVSIEHMHPLTSFMMGMLLKAYTGGFGALTPKDQGGEYEYDDKFLNKRDFEVIDEMLELFRKSNPNSQTQAFQMAQAISAYAVQRWNIDKNPPDPNNPMNNPNQIKSMCSMAGAKEMNNARKQGQEQLDQQLQEAGVDPSMGGTNTQITRELNNIREEAKRKLGKVKGIEQFFDLGDWFKYRDEGMVNHMIAALRKWKVGWKEVIGEYGSQIDVEKMIVNELNQSPIDDFYRRREKMTPKDWVTILLDTSSSMDNDIEMYKTALISMTEALDFLGTNYSLYIFNDYMAGVQENMSEEDLEALGLCGVTGAVKTFDEKRMEDRNKAIVAGLEGCGGTPMGTAIQEFMATKDFKRTRHMLILTDGGATDGDNFREALKLMNAKKLDYHFIGIDDPDSSGWASVRSSYECWNEEGLLPMHRFSVTTLYEIPRTVVNILLGRRGV